MMKVFALVACLSVLGAAQINNGGSGGSGSLPAIPGGNTSGGLYVNTTADFSSIFPPGDPTNLGINIWSRGQSDKDTYIVLQAGNTADRRAYIAFVDVNGSYRWLTGKNSSNNTYILYDATAGGHRMVLQSDPSGIGGTTILNSNDNFPVRINASTGLDTLEGTGGFQVWGHNSGSNHNNFTVNDDGDVQGTPFGEASTPPTAGFSVRVPTGHIAISGQSDLADTSNPTISTVWDSVGLIGGWGSANSTHEGSVSTMQFFANTGRQIGLYANNSLTPTLLIRTDNTVVHATHVFSALAACAAGTEGSIVPVTDSTTVTWGATITGSGTHHVLAYCDGTNWTVAAQ